MMMGMDKELNQLRNEAEIKKHTGFCMVDYSSGSCNDCFVESECLKLFIKEKAELNRDNSQ